MDCRILNRLARTLVDDPEYGVERLTCGILQQPAGQRFGHAVHIRDAAVDVGGDDGVANAAQRHAQQFAALAGAQLGNPPGFSESDNQERGEE